MSCGCNLFLQHIIGCAASKTSRRQQVASGRPISGAKLRASQIQTFSSSKSPSGAFPLGSTSSPLVWVGLHTTGAGPMRELVCRKGCRSSCSSGGALLGSASELGGRACASTSPFGSNCNCCSSSVAPRQLEGPFPASPSL